MNTIHQLPTCPPNHPFPSLMVSFGGQPSKTNILTKCSSIKHQYTKQYQIHDIIHLQNIHPHYSLLIEAQVFFYSLMMTL